MCGEEKQLSGLQTSGILRRLRAKVMDALNHATPTLDGLPDRRWHPRDCDALGSCALPLLELTLAFECIPGNFSIMMHQQMRNIRKRMFPLLRSHTLRQESKRFILSFCEHDSFSSPRFFVMQACYLNGLFF